MPGGQCSFMPVSLYITATLSPDLKAMVSSKLTINLSPLSRWIWEAQYARPPLCQTSPVPCFTESLLSSLLQHIMADSNISPDNNFLNMAMILTGLFYCQMHFVIKWLLRHS